MNELEETKLLLAYKDETANTFMNQVKKLQSDRAHLIAALKEAKEIVREGATSDSYVEQSFRRKYQKSLATINQALEKP